MKSAASAKSGPTEHSEISPKLLSRRLSPPAADAMPTPSAIRKGTLTGPVVTPPESNTRGRSVDLPFSASTAQNEKTAM